jgi:lactoylglutathione lyase
MRYLHTMLRVRNLDTALKFYQDALGLKEVRRIDNDKAKFTLVFLCAPEDEALLKSLPQTRGAPLVELTYNWDEEKYGEDRHFGHLAYEVDDIYARSAFDRAVAEGRAQAARRAVELDAEYRPLVIRLPTEPAFALRVVSALRMGRGLLLWLLGVPIPVIILLWPFFGR